MVDQSSSPYVNSVLHAVRILELYAAQRRESLSLTEISRALSLHKNDCISDSANPAACRLD